MGRVFFAGLVIFSALLVHNERVLADSKYRNLCSELLLRQTFLESFKYARQLHRSLAPANQSFLKAIGWSFRDQITLDKIAKYFSHRVKGNAQISAALEIYRDPGEENPHVVLLLTFFRKGQPRNPIGFTARLIKRDKKGNLVAHGYGFYLDPTANDAKGISETSLHFLNEKIYRVLNVKQERILADYIGRYVWAKAGYQFDNSAYFWNGPRLKTSTIKPLQLVRENFLRFLKSHKIRLTDLLIRSPGKRDKPVTTIDDLQTPADFAYVVHQHGVSLRVAPIVAENKVGEDSEMNIGKAFMLSDYRADEDGSYICSPMGTRFSDRAMPKWYAVREVH